MKKIRVLHILSDTNIGGAGRLLFNLFEAIDKSKFEFIFVFPKGSALINLFKKQGRVYSYSGKGDKSFDITSIISIRNIIKLTQPHIIHTHSSLSGRISAIICGISKKRVIYTKHCVFDVPNFKKQSLCRIIYRFFDNLLAGNIVAVADSAKKELIDIGIAPTKITTIINGSLPQKRISNKEKTKLKQTLGISPQEFVVGICARLEEYKGHKTFIDAALLAKNENQNIKFIIIGDGRKREELKNYVEELELQRNVIFTGFIENVAEYMNILDLNVNCSTGTETSSLAISEGLSLGIPAIVSNFGGNPNMVKNGIAGFVFEKNSSEQLYKIIKSLKNAPEILTKMRGNAIKDFNERFSADQMARQYEEFYISVINKCSR